MYALVEIKGKQYRVEQGSKLTVDLYTEQEGLVEVDRVLMLNHDGTLQLGRPYVPGAKVVLRLEGRTTGPKLRIFRYKKRKNCRRTNGHRQKYSTAVVESISCNA